MINYIFKGLINALIMFVMLNLVGALIWSLSFEIRCGLIGPFSESCSFWEYYMDSFGEYHIDSFWEYYMDSLAWSFMTSSYYGSIFFLISGVGGSILAYKFKKPISRVYLANTIIFVIVLLFILIIGSDLRFLFLSF